MPSAKKRNSKGHFHRVSAASSRAVGSACVLAVTMLGTGTWVMYGWWSSFSVRWFLVTNMAMTVSVFLILLVLQHSRQMHRRAIHTKLNELIRAGDGGNHMIASERLADDMLDELRSRHREIANRDRD